MGCDGGTIPRRDELVRVQKKPEQVKYAFHNFILIKCRTVVRSFLNVNIVVPSPVTVFSLIKI